jgi:hypothetical protein
VLQQHADVNLGIGAAQWLSLKLIRCGCKARERNWWLGWNGARLARNTDTKKLVEQHPEIQHWVIGRLRCEHRDLKPLKEDETTIR